MNYRNPCKTAFKLLTNADIISQVKVKFWRFVMIGFSDAAEPCQMETNPTNQRIRYSKHFRCTLLSLQLPLIRSMSSLVTMPEKVNLLISGSVAMRIFLGQFFVKLAINECPHNFWWSSNKNNVQNKKKLWKSRNVLLFDPRKGKKCQFWEYWPECCALFAILCYFSYIEF